MAVQNHHDRSCQPTRRNHMRTVTLPVEGLNFATCTRSIEKRLGALAAIKQVDASYVSQTVTVTFDETHIGEDVLRDLVKDCGFACGEPMVAVDRLQAWARAAHGHSVQDGSGAAPTHEQHALAHHPGTTPTTTATLTT